MTTPAPAPIANLYDALTEPGKKDVTALLESCLTPDWTSHGSPGNISDRAHFIAKVKGFGALIPDLAFTVKDVIISGDKIVVRSEATGTPVKEFMGLSANGKSFRIMTIDIHTIRDGKSAEVHHVEDWTAAMMQLRG